MSSIPRVGKAIESFGTPSSFDQELRDLLWARCTKALFIGLAVTLIMTVLYSVLFRNPPIVAESLSTLKTVTRFGHPGSFALALACPTFALFGLNRQFLFQTDGHWIGSPRGSVYRACRSRLSLNI